MQLTSRVYAVDMIKLFALGLTCLISVSVVSCGGGDGSLNVDVDLDVNVNDPSKKSPEDSQGATRPSVAELNIEKSEFAMSVSDLHPLDIRAVLSDGTTQLVDLAKLIVEFSPEGILEFKDTGLVALKEGEVSVTIKDKDSGKELVLDVTVVSGDQGGNTDVDTDPNPNPNPDPNPDPDPNPTPVPTPDPDPNPTPDPTPDPDPDPTPTPDPTPDPDPNPTPDPTPDPDPTPTPDPAPNPDPTPTPDPAPDPDPNPTPDPTPDPTPTPDPQACEVGNTYTVLAQQQFTGLVAGGTYKVTVESTAVPGLTQFVVGPDSSVPDNFTEPDAWCVQYILFETTQVSCVVTAKTDTLHASLGSLQCPDAETLPAIAITEPVVSSLKAAANEPLALGVATDGSMRANILQETSTYVVTPGTQSGPGYSYRISLFNPSSSLQLTVKAKDQSGSEEGCTSSAIIQGASGPEISCDLPDLGLKYTSINVEVSAHAIFMPDTFEAGGATYSIKVDAIKAN